MKKLRTAVAGLGRIGWNYHIPNIIKHEGFELSAITDPMVERLEEGKEKFLVAGYTDFQTMLESEKLDLLVIASPTPFHYEQAITAMEHGIDVFLEKPMAQSLNEAKLISECMERTGRKLMVYQPHRATSEVLAAISIIEKEIIGKVYMVKRSISQYMRRNDWQSQKKFGGGMLNNYGAHLIDQMLYLTSSTAKNISCSLKNIASIGDADDVVKIIIETQSDLILDIDINMAAALRLPEWIIMGDRGTAILERKDHGKAVFNIRYYNQEELQTLDLKAGLAAQGRTYDNFDNIKWHEEEIPISDFEPLDFYNKCYDYYALGKEAFVPVHQTLEVMRVINECRNDAGW